MKTFDKLYIDGAWVAPSSSDTLEVIDSTSEEVYATVPAGTPADIDRAVAAAKAAFPAWSETSAPKSPKCRSHITRVSGVFQNTDWLVPCG